MKPSSFNQLSIIIVSIATASLANAQPAAPEHCKLPADFSLADASRLSIEERALCADTILKLALTRQDERDRAAQLIADALNFRPTIEPGYAQQQPIRTQTAPLNDPLVQAYLLSDLLKRMKATEAKLLEVSLLLEKLNAANTRNDPKKPRK